MNAHMNTHERDAWRTLLDLGATRVSFAGKAGLDVTPIRITSNRKMAQFARAFNEVAGRSGAVRRHVDRSGSPVYVVTDEAGL